MFITSFGEQNITYKCCSNFLIHLSNLLGFLWFEFNSQNNTIEFNLGKSPSANKFRGFTQSILNDMDHIKNYLPKKWFNNSMWLVCRFFF